MRILICDDKEEDVDALSKFIRTMKCDETIVVESYTDTVSAEKRIRKQLFDMAYLGPVIHQESGFELAKILLKFQPDCIYFLICDDYQYLHEGFRSGAFQMLLRDQTDLIDEEFQRALRKYKERNYNFNFYLNNGKSIVLIPSEIEYIKYDGKETIVATTNNFYIGHFDCIQKVKYELKKYSFIQINSMYYINMSNIDLIRQNEVQMYNGETISVSLMYRNFIEKEVRSYFLI